MRKIALFIIILICAGLVIGAVYYRYNLTGGSPHQQGSPPLAVQPPGTGESINHPSKLVYLRQVYGHSGENRELEVFRISSNPKPAKKILCVFALHGFEDAFYRDGRLLTDTAHYVIADFKENSLELGTFELLVIPSANPDGVSRGWTCNGPGRCQTSLGIDMNMDFDYLFKTRANARNLTGDRPLASPEARALRDLVLAEKPEIVIDFHGWVNSAAGDPQLSAIFNRIMGLSLRTEEGSIKAGYFSGWAGKHARAVLVEYPDPFTGQGAYEKKTEFNIDYKQDMQARLGFGSKTVECLKEIMKQNS